MSPSVLSNSKLAEIYHIFFLLQPATVLTMIGSYGLILLCLMSWYAKKIPMRIYYDEANDKTFAIFMHLLIPFRFSKKSLPHHTFRIVKDSKDGKRISNGQLNLMLTPEMFRKPVDFTRLLSQWIKSFVESVSGVIVEILNFHFWSFHSFHIVNLSNCSTHYYDQPISRIF